MNFVAGGGRKMLISSCSFRKRSFGLLCVLGIYRAHKMVRMFDFLFILQHQKYAFPVLFCGSVNMNFVAGPWPKNAYLFM